MTEKSSSFLFAISRWISTVFCVGFSPWAPGTLGTLAALPLVYFLAPTSDVFRLTFWMGLGILGTFLSGVYARGASKADPKEVVIDEVLGYGVAALSVGQNPWGLCVAFVAFRIFDILKPPPVRNLDQWSKKQTGVWGLGLGIMLDDLLAGVMAWAVTWAVLGLGNWMN